MRRIAPDELGRLYRAHARALCLYARQWPDGDEDLVQDAFVKLAQQSPAPEQVLPWLYRVVRNGALAAGRGAARRRRREKRVSAAAGRAAGRRGRLLWPALCTLLAAQAAGLWAWGLSERTERVALAGLLHERAPAPNIPPAPAVAEFPAPRYSPSPDDYFHLRRRL